MSIVYAVDFSATGRAGAQGAAALAVRLGVELVLVHVAAGEAADALDLLPPLEREAALLRAAFPGLAARALCVPGTAHRDLARLAREQGASLLVVASGGHAEAPLRRLGGTSERLAAQAEMPLLVLHGALPFARWDAAGAALRLLVAGEDPRVLPPLLALASTLRQAGPCDVLVTHLYFVPTERRRLGLEREISWVDDDPQLVALLERDLAAVVGRLPGAGEQRVRAQLCTGRPAEHLLELAERERADLVIVGARPESRLERMGSLSSGVLHAGRMAVALVPLAGAAVAARPVPAYRRVLVTTDFSPFADEAIAHAYALVRDRPQAEVHLLHVDEEHAGPSAADAELVARLRALLPPEGAGEGVLARTHVAHGRPVAALVVAAAERLAVDVVCLAAHGRSGLRREILGSVAQEVVQRSGRPVLLVRPPAREGGAA